MARQVRTDILYIVKAKDLFKNVRYFPYYYEDIGAFKRDLKKDGYTNIQAVAYETHNAQTTMAEDMLKKVLKLSDLEKAEKALSIIYKEQEDK